jgi:polyhydroxybutyrate depolymerase
VNGDGDFTDAGERKVGTKWAAGKLGDPTQLPLCSADEIAALPAPQQALVGHPLMDDVAFTRAMLDFLATHYAIDARRIYVAGFSNGASFAARLVLEMSDRFAAAGLGSGGLNLPPAPARPMSVIQFFGSEDQILTAELGVSSIPVEESVVTELPGIATELIDPLLTTLSLADAHTYEERLVVGKKVASFVYAQSTAGATNRYRLLLLEGMTHEYPNGTNYPVVAADFLWELFRTQALPQ